jgi:energy-coupling factor transport system ATP-binding protein
MRIQIDHVSFTYPGDIKALEDVSLTIQPGEKVAITGRNGSGKTTLARHLNGLFHPQTGRILIGDWPTTEHSPAQLARRVAYVFQNPDEQLFHRRVWEEIAFGPQNLGYSPREVESRVREAVDQMGLADFAQMNPRDLGYSNRKQVALASALAMHTPIVVLDEPTAGLDTQELEQLSQTIQRFYQQGKTVLVISHDMDFVAENLDRVVLMQAGQVIFDAPTRQFFSEARLLESSGLVVPQMTRLSQRLGLSQAALNVEELVNQILRGSDQ